MLSVPSDYLDMEVPLPADLRRFGETTTLRITGRTSAPAVAVLGGISGNRFVCRGEGGGSGWWPGLVGEGCAIDPELHCILGLDFAADATGKCAPSTDDQARVLAAALDVAGIEKLHALVGASYGGMVGLAFASLFPGRIDRIAVISAAAEPHAAGTAVRELQRRIVALGLENSAADEALSIARGLAMLTYRTPEELAVRFAPGIGLEDPLSPSEPGRYLRARGEAFRAVMSPQRFLSLSASIDRHRVAAESIACPALLIGANSDQLVPPAQMQALAAGLGGPTSLHLRDCLYGHDMFLKEAEAMGELLKPFLVQE
ncbi:MAG TPA: homoserine O-succinyltransferase [Allosphingosinicella sp.]|jgi:homoserine O-acetyltransferase